MAEMLDQRDWKVPDWVVLPGGNLGNVSAFGKACAKCSELGLIDRLPRLAVVQAEGAAPFYDLMHSADRSQLNAVGHPETLATAIKIGDPVSWPKALHEIRGDQRRGGEGHRAGNRRRQGGDRAVRDRLRAGLGRDPGRNPEAPAGGSDARRMPTSSRCLPGMS